MYFLGHAQGNMVPLLSHIYGFSVLCQVWTTKKAPKAELCLWRLRYISSYALHITKESAENNGGED